MSAEFLSNNEDNEEAIQEKERYNKLKESLVLTNKTIEEVNVMLSASDWSRANTPIVSNFSDFLHNLAMFLR